MDKQKKDSLVGQAAFLVAAMLGSRVLGFLYRIPMTHYIGDDGNAYYAAGYQIYNFFLILSSAGLPAAISKLVSERAALRRYRDAHAVFQTALALSALMGVVCALAMLFGAGRIAALLGQPKSHYSMLTLSPTLLIVGIMAVFRGYFQGMGTTKPTAFSQIIEQIFNASFSILLAYAFYQSGPEFGAAGGTAGTGIGAAAGLIVMLLIYKLNSKIIARRLQKDHSPQRESYQEIASSVLKTAWPIILGTAVFSISGLIDTIMVTNCLEASGAFSTAQIDQMYGQFHGKYVTLTTLPITISAAMAAAAVPSVASSNALGDAAAVESKINLGIRMAMLFSVPAAIGLSILGGPILRLLFPSHPAGAELLQWGGVGVIFLALAQITTGMLQGVGRVKLPVVGAAAGAVVKIALNWLFITNPGINIRGAVLSTIGCYAVASGIDIYYLWKSTRARIDFMGSLVKPLACSAAMGIASYGAYEASYYLTARNSVSVVLSIAFGAVVYFFSMIFVRGIGKADMLSLPMGKKLAGALDKLGM